MLTLRRPLNIKFKTLMAAECVKGINGVGRKKILAKGELRAIIFQSFGRNVVDRASDEPTADHFAETRQFPKPGLPAPVIERQIQKVQRPLERLVAVWRIILGFQAPRAAQLAADMAHLPGERHLAPSLRGDHLIPPENRRSSGSFFAGRGPGSPWNGCPRMAGH